VWKRRVGYRDPKIAYLILLDAAGPVAWTHAGDFDDQAYGKLSTEVPRLLK
jgi:hypothetical protein